METFTLVVWFFLGSRMEVVRTENLTQAECIAKLEEVLATGHKSATCRGWYQPPIWREGWRLGVVPWPHLRVLAVAVADRA
jgi:hypothetical protein